MKDIGDAIGHALTVAALSAHASMTRKPLPGRGKADAGVSGSFDRAALGRFHTPFNKVGAEIDRPSTKDVPDPYANAFALSRDWPVAPKCIALLLARRTVRMTGIVHA